jgi:fructose-1,6-bisphosphatase
MFLHLRALLKPSGQLRDLFRLNALAALALASAFAQAQTQTSGLSLDQALQMATQRSASSLAVAASVQASREIAAKSNQ